MRDHHNTLYNQLKAKNSDLSVVKEEEEKCKDALDADERRGETGDIPTLFKERDSIRKEIAEHRDTMRKLRDISMRSVRSGRHTCASRKR